MNSRQKNIYLLILLILLLITINYPFLDKQLINFIDKKDTAFVERVIDGDTIVIEGNSTSVRMLGINTPERGEQGYSEAKRFLEELILNKVVKLEYGKEKHDRYKRILSYVYLDNQNVNLELIERGFANYYFPAGKNIHYKEFKGVWEKCVDNNINLCEKSKDICANCIELKEFNHKKQEVILYNKCYFDCDLRGWGIKDEGRKNFVFEDFILNSKKEIKVIVDDKTDTKDILYWKGEDYVWTSTGDTLFLRDDSNKLVLWESY